MRFKRHVDASGIHPRMWQVLLWLDQQHLEWTEETVWITSLRRPYKIGHDTRHATAFAGIRDPRVSSSRNSFVTAVDIRRWALDELDKAEEFCRHVQHSYGEQIGVLLEPEWLTRRQLRQRFPDLSEKAARKKVGPHIHLQLKKPIRWTTLV